MSKKKGGLLKFVAGLGLGIGLGMLFAPKKGEELRKELKEKLKLEKKERLLTRIKRILKIAGIALALLLIFGVLFFVILTILK